MDIIIMVLLYFLCDHISRRSIIIVFCTLFLSAAIISFLEIGRSSTPD